MIDINLSKYGQFAFQNIHKPWNIHTQVPPESTATITPMELIFYNLLVMLSGEKFELCI